MVVDVPRLVVAGGLVLPQGIIWALGAELACSIPGNREVGGVEGA